MSDSWLEVARQYCESHGNDKPFLQVAKEWREHPWTAEDCVSFGEEIASWMADFGKLVMEEAQVEVRIGGPEQGTLTKFRKRTEAEVLAALKERLEKR